jgi:hypothetical protein
MIRSRVVVLWGVARDHDEGPFMAKRETKKVEAIQEERLVKPVRLDLTLTDHQRLERQAKRRGLTMASYARMVILERLEADEGGSK